MSHVTLKHVQPNISRLWTPYSYRSVLTAFQMPDTTPKTAKPKTSPLDTSHFQSHHDPTLNLQSKPKHWSPPPLEPLNDFAWRIPHIVLFLALPSLHVVERHHAVEIDDAEPRAVAVDGELVWAARKLVLLLESDVRQRVSLLCGV